MTSLAFNIKIKVLYYLPFQYGLNEKLFSNGFVDKEILILENISKGYFQSVFEKGSLVQNQAFIIHNCNLLKKSYNKFPIIKNSKLHNRKREKKLNKSVDDLDCDHFTGEFYESGEVELVLKHKDSYSDTNYEQIFNVNYHQESSFQKNLLWDIDIHKEYQNYSDLSTDLYDDNNELDCSNGLSGNNQQQQRFYRPIRHFQGRSLSNFSASNNDDKRTSLPADLNMTSQQQTLADFHVYNPQQIVLDKSYTFPFHNHRLEFEDPITPSPNQTNIRIDRNISSSQNTQQPT